jgi:hypothetical protein
VLRWEYLVRRTQWVEASRTADYITWIKYRHIWHPDGEAESEYPSDSGFNALGQCGWELAAMTSGQASLLTRSSPQGGDSYTSFPVHTMIFKRPGS